MYEHFSPLTNIHFLLSFYFLFFRGGRSGISHTFFTDNDKSLAGALVSVLKEANQEIPEAMFKYSMVTKKKEHATYGAFGPKVDLIGKKAIKIRFDD